MILGRILKNPFRKPFSGNCQCNKSIILLLSCVLLSLKPIKNAGIVASAFFLFIRKSLHSQIIHIRHPLCHAAVQMGEHESHSFYVRQKCIYIVYLMCYDIYTLKERGFIMPQVAAIVNVRVEENLKRDIEKLFDSLGMNISTAVNMFFKQCLMEQGLPYQPKVKHRQSLKAYLENYYGKDFDSILKDREKEGYENPVAIIESKPAGKEIW